MDLLIFVDVNNENASTDQVWSKKQRFAVCKGLTNYQIKYLVKTQDNIQEYVNKKCIGPVFETLFEYHRIDKLTGGTTVEEVYHQSKIFFECIKSACSDSGLDVTYHSGV